MTAITIQFPLGYISEKFVGEGKIVLFGLSCECT